MRFPLFIAVFLASVLLGSLGFSASAEETLWTCGMHPQIIKHEPGNCPICGMKLVPVRAGSAATASERTIKFYKSTMNPGEVSPKPGKDSMGMEMVPVYDDAGANTIKVDPAIVQRMNLKTAVVTRGPVRREIRTVGAVAYDEETLRDISLKFDGWIEQLFVNTTWAKIKAGERLFEVYSPDLYNAELNFVIARNTEGEANGPLTRAAMARLQLSDVPKEVIDELVQSRKAPRTFVYRSPVNGVIIEKSVVAGQMVKPGERIYRIADLSTVWVLAQVYEQDLPFVQAGVPATVQTTYGPERTYAGEVTLLEPQVQEQTRSVTARIALPNPDGALRPGMYTDVRFEARIADAAILVPESAILRSGDRNTVFVAKDGDHFEPREVTLGARSADGSYEVLSGVSEGERVVTSGQFMFDSESQLREAIEKMSSGSAGVSASAGAATPSSVASNGPGASHQQEPTPELIALANASADAATALAKDDLAGYNKQRETVNNAVSAWLARNVDATNMGGVRSSREYGSGVGAPHPQQDRLAALPLAADLKSARETFEPFSTAVTDMARAAHLDHTLGLHAFECPMPPSGIGKGRWLQHTAGTQNPFYGSAMPTCGEELK